MRRVSERRSTRLNSTVFSLRDAAPPRRLHRQSARLSISSSFESCERARFLFRLFIERTIETINKNYTVYPIIFFIHTRASLSLDLSSDAARNRVRYSQRINRNPSVYFYSNKTSRTERDHSIFLKIPLFLFHTSREIIFLRSIAFGTFEI